MILTRLARNGRCCRLTSLTDIVKAYGNNIQRHLAIEDTDAIINAFYENLYLHQDEKPLLEDMTVKEKAEFARREADLKKEPESQHLDQVVDQQTDILANSGINGHQSIGALDGEKVGT